METKKQEVDNMKIENEEMTKDIWVLEILGKQISVGELYNLLIIPLLLSTTVLAWHAGQNDAYTTLRTLDFLFNEHTDGNITRITFCNPVADGTKIRIICTEDIPNIAQGYNRT